jgi:hypothetical protein
MRNLPHDRIGVQPLILCNHGLAMVLAAVSVLLINFDDNANAQVFDWTYNLGDSVHPGTIPVPELNNASGSQLANFLASQTSPTVKVLDPLSGTIADTFFDGPTPLTQILGGFENPLTGGDALTAIQIENLVNQTNLTASSAATISQFGLDNYHPDNTNPTPSAGLSDINYNFSDVNAASPNLFPGSSSFRSPAFGFFPPNGSSAKNIRSSLFTLPIMRLSEVFDTSPAGDAILPFVSRFNSLGSPLVNSEYNSIPAYETTDQLLSRSDYQSLIVHYRMRGADGVIAHTGGVVGYSHSEFLDDTRDGWNFLNSIYQGDMTPINLSTLGIEFDSRVYSGVVGDVPSGKRVATILISNPGPNSGSVETPDQIEGFNVLSFDSQVNVVDAGKHKLLTFWLDNNAWLFLGSGDIFDEQTISGDSNGGIGIGFPLNPIGNNDGIFNTSSSSSNIPEPTSLSLFVSICVLVTSRRRIAK